MPVLRQRSQVALSLVVLLFLISPLFAQAPALAIPATTDTGPFPTIPSEALLHQTEIQNVLQQGAGMEAQGDWGGAVAHYEESLLKFGYVPRIEKRKSHALKNYHLEIRLSDTSYSQAVQNLTERQAQNLLGEVLAKIQIYYVDAPDWSTLFREGTDQLKVSLLNQEFRQKFHPNVNKDRRQQLLTYLEKAATTAKLYSQADLQRKIVEVADKANYYLDIPQTLTTLEYQCGMVHSLDKYSSFLSPNQFRDLYSQIEGNFVGLGIELKIEPGQLKVVQVLDKSPAREQGIVPGDSILAVNGQSVEKLTGNVAANMLRGKPGTTIQLTLQKSDRRQYSLTLSRKQIDVPSVTDAKFLNKDRGIAYLRLPVFQKNTSEELEKSMWELYHQGMKSLVLDLRGNPGGLLDISIETADKFIENGTIVATKGRSPGETFDYQAHRIGTWRVPLVVLIDRNTASASEIFAGAIKDHNRGWVIGEKSYGKGSVQGIFPLTGMQSGLRLTTAKFYSPSGKAISNTGIAPGITVHTTYKPSTDGKEILEQDPVILAAIRTLSQAQERAQQQSGSVTSSLN